MCQGLQIYSKSIEKIKLGQKLLSPENLANYYNNPKEITQPGWADEEFNKFPSERAKRQRVDRRSTSYSDWPDVDQRQRQMRLRIPAGQ